MWGCGLYFFVFLCTVYYVVIKLKKKEPILIIKQYLQWYICRPCINSSINRWHFVFSFLTQFSFSEDLIYKGNIFSIFRPSPVYMLAISRRWCVFFLAFWHNFPIDFSYNSNKKTAQKDRYRPDYPLTKSVSILKKVQQLSLNLEL